MLFFKNHFGMVVSTVMVAVLSVCMASIAMPIFGIPVTPVSWYQNVSVSFMTLFVASVILPVKIWGDQMATAMKLERKTFAFGVAANIIPSLIFNTIATIVLPAVNIFYNEYIPAEAQFGIWLDAVFSGWPIMFVISFVLAFVGESIALKVAFKSVHPSEIRNNKVLKEDKYG